MKTVKNEWLHWIILSVPFIYLATVYPKLPDIVPTHFDANGIPNDYSHKTIFLWMIPLLTIGIYLLMLVIPVIDPKRTLSRNPKIINSLRLVFTIVFSALSIVIIYISQPKANLQLGTHLIMASVGVLFMLLGNYLTAVPPNYFIGIRTPWTLEDPVVWQKTHRIFGRVFFFVGLLITILVLVLPQNDFISGFFILCVIVPAIGSLVYSYLLFKKLHPDKED